MRTLVVAAIIAVVATAVASSQSKEKRVSATSAGEEEIREALRAWDEAYAARDTATLGNLLADEFICTDTLGIVVDKTQYLMSIVKAPDTAQQTHSSDDVVVRMYGDSALVTGRSTFKGRARGKGQFARAQYRFTDVWVKRQGRWQAVATQGTQLAP